MRTLSKSKLLAFRQCPRRLWLEIHRPELREDSTGTKARFAVGNSVGDVARRLYDSKQAGVLLNAQTEGFDTVFARSKQLLETPAPIFEAGYRADNTVAFADVMLPTQQTGPLTWRMVEVKSSTRVKDYHREDAAIQAYVAKSAGVPLDAISIACVDSSWVYPGDEQYQGLLKETDVSEEAFGRSADVQQWISQAHTIAESNQEPVLSTGDHCATPFECGFIDYCRSKEPQSQHSLDLLPGAKSKALRAYIEEHDVRELEAVPDALLNARQLRVKTQTVSATVFFDATAAAAELTAAKLPAYFLDFESIQFAVPIWKGTRPYQQIPFQYSLHRLSRSNALEHTSFLDLSGDNPSKSFAEALVQACGERGPIFVYNAGFEKGRVAELANTFAKLRKPLLAINERMVDLLPVAQRHYYNPSQMGSWSLKAVVPAVAPELSYEALEGVKDGGLAMEAYLEAIHPETPPSRKTALEQQLLKYCELDTLSLVALWRVFSGVKPVVKTLAKWDAYEHWLQANFKAATVTTQLSQARRLEKVYGNLDEHFDRDQFTSILADLKYTAADKDAGNPNPSRVQIDGDNVYGGLVHLRGALGYYGRFRSAGAPVEWPALEAMRQRFLELCPDFLNFEQGSGIYFDTERSYKEALILRVRAITAGAAKAPQDVGLELLDLLAAKPSNFVGWRAFAQIDEGGDQVKATVAQALGELVMSPEPATAAAATAAARIQPIFTQGASGRPAYSLVRTLVTSALALAKPSEAICVKTRFMRKAAKALTGDTIFKPSILSAEDYGAFLDLAERIHRTMTNWGWKPQDLWDVQGFLWVVTSDDWKPQANGSTGEAEDDGDDEPMNDKASHPLNQILFGPPGTGKTWATARLAVDICNGDAPVDRLELMGIYNDLVKAGRIAFTTFHQSIGYEEFVEGLRPVTDSEEGDDRAAAGFRLEARNGIFRNICEVAERARKQPGRPTQFDFTGRRFFKMSLGRARTESQIYDAAIEGNYIALGWGGDLDWSDSKYVDYDAVFERWQEKEPGTSGNSGNIAQIWRFRTMKKGDIVIVSDGNSRFRAIGEVTGDYQFKLRDEGYNHRRPVRWLAVLEKSLPIETIFDGQLSQASCYLLNSKRIKLQALAEQFRTDSTDSQAPPETFVLIIDEINRANVSKVLGELITLLEPDKRLGTPNALTVKLPYSLEEFGVPNNLYVIGTMNTADRSIALLDTALRRRFHFTEMMPDYECLNREVDGIHLGRLLSGINRRVEWLFDRDHQIGHSFFTSVESKKALDEVMQSKLIPLLSEYFYDDWEKVRIALNDTGSWFVGVEKLPVPRMLQEEGQERSRYSIKRGEVPVEAYVAAASEAA